MRANEAPDRIGTYPRIVLRDYCYMGCPYCPELVPNDSEFHGIYFTTFQHSEYWPYDTRRKTYLSSTFALGFQSQENIVNQHVSQRIYEGLAYGCIVLTNSRPAVEQTENCCLLVTTREEVEDQMRFFKSHPDLLQERQRRGYEFCRRTGTNDKTVDLLLETIQHTVGVRP